MNYHSIDCLNNSAAVKERCAQILEVALKGVTHFRVDLKKLPECAALVAKVTKERSPTLQLLPHARWSHSNCGGAIFDIVTQNNTSGDVSAVQIFRAVLDLFGGIWPTHPNSFGVALGDVWEHPAIKGTNPKDKLVPFHKLSLWLTFSLFHGFEIGGFNIKDVDELPGLAEYRNGGLLVDSGVLVRKDLSEAGPFEPNHQMIIEWRALTIALLDKVADQVRAILGKSKSEFPLAAVLEGGTWFAGRKLAAQNRPDSSPPIPVVNKGNVF
jgi:hypothetical protein